MEQDKRNLIILTLLGAALFLLANGHIPVTDPVESNYTQTAKEMLLSGDYMSPRIFGNYWYDKPAFFYWELIAAFKVFGVTDFAARFFSSVFGVIGLLLTYVFARRLYDARTALLSGVILATSLGYWVISKAVITDITLFVFFDAVLVFFYIAYTGKNKNIYYFCYFFAGLAVLTKGPIGILLPGLIVTLFICAQRDFTEIPRMKPLGFAIFFAVVAAWYVPMYFAHGSEFVDTFLGVHNVLRATVSEHPMWDVWWYY
ncbi:MAG: glycosyltransferase family 39 protein, partial [Schwartzia sp.]|nr:glycosyltransferase family 39 protein [Schwartzia sp. (in: firmicutes)]